jgi:serine/threonine protein kinase
VIERERAALDRLEERDRTWTIHPSFEYEARQWIVVPVVPARGKSLATSVRLDDPRRSEGGLPQQVAVGVVADAFRGLAEVHESGLVHRGIYPKRVFLGRRLRVKFSDFYLARISGEQTIAANVTADSDAGRPYRAPECRDSIGFASPASDVYSLALSLAGWLLGEAPLEPDVDAVRRSISQFPTVGPIVAGCLADDPRQRLTASAVVQEIEAAAATSAQGTAVTGAGNPSPDTGSTPGEQRDFRIGGVIADRYEVLDSLGCGGFARTWKVRDTNTETQRVIKQFHDGMAPDFARLEYAAMDRINHDNCARVYDIDRYPPGFLVLEYVPGENLKKYSEAGHLTDEGYRTIALDILSGLRYLHNPVPS